MPDFNISALKALAKKEETHLGEVKTYEVQNETIYIHTGRVALAVTEYMPNHPSGKFSFDDRVEVGGVNFSPWFCDRWLLTNMKYQFSVSVDQLIKLYKPIKAWLSGRPKKQDYEEVAPIPYAQLEVYRHSGSNCSLEFTGGGVDGMPDLTISSVAGLLPDDGRFLNYTFAYNAVEFENALRLFATLKNATEPVLFRYTGDPKDPWFMSIEHLGQELFVGMPFEVPDESKKAGVDPKQDHLAA